MDTLLDALQEGRLFELPEHEKIAALQFLAHVIEAFPEVPAGTDIVGLVMKREEMINTGIGKRWACPHARVPFEEDLKSVIGWSPKGIDYGAPDGKPVMLIVMYLIPVNQRNHYLREVSMLAKALTAYPNHEKLEKARDLDDVRSYLLDLIDSTRDSVIPDVRTRMIRLHSKVESVSMVQDLSNMVIEYVTVIVSGGCKPIVLCYNLELIERLEQSEDFIKKLETDGSYFSNGWKIMRHNVTSYPGGRTIYNCIAIKIKGADKE